MSVKNDVSFIWIFYIAIDFDWLIYTQTCSTYSTYIVSNSSTSTSSYPNVIKLLGKKKGNWSEEYEEWNMPSGVYRVYFYLFAVRKNQQQQQQIEKKSMNKNWMVSDPTENRTFMSGRLCVCVWCLLTVVGLH